ncbi:hypothetical protein [Sphingomonas sp. 10B4]|uniref:hypothetical protein n=1 Tax=Sphingomonas sp. 10B4 TaxID=3048575 RepID=UPI002AB37715|nr:hypothetical protein [Sphingomonas sp. 10B4]MDY7522559.1 hypothetical protein [Sphingomonas sp. 10B4]MEB0283331.1 hypothetical protein [Sphingomonas sp. 10B4]
MKCRLRSTALLLGTGLAALIAAAPAQAQDQQRRTRISPYIEIGQIVTADLKNDDVLTYSTVAGGVEASVQTPRTQLQVSYRYERHFSYAKRVGDDDLHNGLARGSIAVAPNLSIEAGAIATQTRTDIRGAAPIAQVGQRDNISQVFSGYVGPSYAARVGPVGVAASYRYGYTKAGSPGTTGVAPGSPRLDVFDSSQSHTVNVSAGVKAGALLPVGINVSAAYDRETANQLDQKLEDKVVRADLVAPVAPTVALTAGVGYQNLQVRQRDALLDANGVPVVDRRGRFQSDPASPQRIAYETDGLIYDAGVIWRPSERTTLQAHVGRRYGGMTYFGTLSYAATRSISVNADVYDTVETFGGQLRNSLAGLPTSFLQQRAAFGQQYSGCTFGAAGAGAGGCLNGALQSISTSAYRARGIDAVISATRGKLNLGVGAGYSNRRFLAPDQINAAFSINGVSDQSYYAQAFANVPLTRVSGINGTLIYNYYDSGIADAPGVTSAAATALYYHNFGRIGTTASAGLYSFSQSGVADQLSATGQVGVRYQF